MATARLVAYGLVALALAALAVLWQGERVKVAQRDATIATLNGLRTQDRLNYASAAQQSEANAQAAALKSDLRGKDITDAVLRQRQEALDSLAHARAASSLRGTTTANSCSTGKANLPQVPATASGANEEVDVDKRVIDHNALVDWIALQTEAFNNPPQDDPKGQGQRQGVHSAP